jgi:hypothetical protein
MVQLANAEGVADVVTLQHVPFGNNFFPTDKCGGAPYDSSKRHCWAAECIGVASPPEDCFTGDVVTQHGAQEYEINRLQACAQHVISGQVGNWPASAENWAKRYWPLVACTEKKFGKGTTEDAAKTCAQEAGVDADDLLACYTGADGDAAILAAAKATVDHAGTPTIEVDGKDTSANSVLSAVCNAISGTKPAGCSKVGAVWRTEARSVCA